MRIDSVYIESFKNLKEFSIDFDEKQMNTVLLGQNATGKSNFIEALILIFKYLDLQKKPAGSDYFDYEIKYFCKKHGITAKLKDNKQEFTVDGKPVTLSAFNHNKNYLPKYIFTYYSGSSDRLNRLFWEHQRRFYNEVKKPYFSISKVNDLRRLFYVQQVHSYFVLLAFYSFKNAENDSKNFLKSLFHIDDIESILFVLKDPGWKGRGDNRFWGADGLVKEFISILLKYSLAPITDNKTIDLDFRHSSNYRRVYLYISDKNKLHALVSDFFKKLSISANNTDLFKALESTYISNLLEEVRVKIRKEVDGEVSFRQLSEGEQQLLTVLGLLKFTKDEESLVLLDEPDTHLNPLWKWEYLKLLNDVVKKPSGKEDDTTHVIINTHDPLVIGSLEHNQIRVFRRDEKKGKVTATEPDISPKGLGVAGILTSELFGLPSTLDEGTLEMIKIRDQLFIKEQKTGITKSEENKLSMLNEKLSSLGFNAIYRDPLYQKFRMALGDMKEFQKPILSENEKVQITEFLRSILHDN